ARPGAGGGSGGGAAEPGKPAVKQPAQPVGAVVPASRTPAERTLLGRLKSALRPD
ncbi:MAG: hypothetical protein K0R62_5212, partial [Nonomuraea muscovyensis]|nr:hypothetical protein [Nonomuraea muscovyensis]